LGIESKGGMIQGLEIRTRSKLVLIYCCWFYM